MHHPGADLFNVWLTYHKVVQANYMHHLQLSEQIAFSLYRQFADRPFSILDLGCGDALTLTPVLSATAVSHYEGVDLSRTALALAEERVKSLPCRTVLTQGDFMDALANGAQRFDVIHSSYALHHIAPKGKAEFFRLAAKRLHRNGILLLADVMREDDESLPVYYQRYCDWLRRDWLELSEDEKNAVCDHLIHYDFPETRSVLRAHARAAGFEDVVELGRFGWHGLFQFKGRTT
jgi:ubiquinone/menaquinone biosynthesis C-methylase UbiE